MSFWAKKAIVTGGAGFIGSHVVAGLQRCGVDVLVLDNLRTGRSDVLQQLGSPAFVNVDINSEAISSIIADAKPDVIFHLAAQINVRSSVEDPVFDAQQNVLGTTRLLEAASKASCRQFVFASTGGAIYGEQDHFPADESHPIKPKCQYGVSKRAAEQYLEFYGRNTDMQTTSLRFANVYGPRQNPKGEAGVVAIFTDRLLARKPLRVNGDGGQTRDFVYVADVAEAMLRVGQLQHAEGYDVFNVGRGIECSVNQIIDELRTVWQALEQDPEAFVVEHGEAMPGEQRRSVITSQKLQAALGDWKPAVTLPEGLLQTVKSFL